jgi:hypothetical protein
VCTPMPGGIKRASVGGLLRPSAAPSATPSPCTMAKKPAGLAASSSGPKTLALQRLRTTVEFGGGADSAPSSASGGSSGGSAFSARKRRGTLGAHDATPLSPGRRRPKQARWLGSGDAPSAPVRGPFCSPGARQTGLRELQITPFASPPPAATRATSASPHKAMACRFPQVLASPRCAPSLGLCGPGGGAAPRGAAVEGPDLATLAQRIAGFRQEAARTASALKLRGVGMLALDFDQTLVSVHTNSLWEESAASQLASLFRPELCALLPAVVAEGIDIAIVTFSAQTALIREAAGIALGNEIERQLVLRSNDGTWQLSVSPRTPRALGKNQHLVSAADEAHRRRHDPQAPLHTGHAVLLVDDDLENIELAEREGFGAYHLRETGLPLLQGLREFKP